MLEKQPVEKVVMVEIELDLLVRVMMEQVVKVLDHLVAIPEVPEQQ